jgi:hypothetical protein
VAAVVLLELGEPYQAVTEELLDRLVDKVRAHYNDGDASGAPLLLSRFGQNNGELLTELKKEFGSLLAAVRATGEARLRIVDDRKGRESVAPADIAASVGLKIQQQAASQIEGSSNFDSLPRAVQIAFCVRTEVEEIVALRVTAPFAYQKVQSLNLIRPGFRALADDYRKPGLALKTATLQDREALWRSFITWTEKEELDPAAFRANYQTNALSRLLAAQQPDIMDRLVIPADIATLLLRRP